MLAPAIPFRLVLCPREARVQVGEVNYSIDNTPYGTLLIAANNQGLCFSAFVGSSVDLCLEDLARLFPRAALVSGISKSWYRGVLRVTYREVPREPIPLVLYGSPLEQATWSALLDIELGQTKSYGEVAIAAGYAYAVRAVASAVGRNVVVPFVPCHRVIPRRGGWGQYSAEGGSDRKRQLLLMEQRIEEIREIESYCGSSISL